MRSLSGAPGPLSLCCVMFAAIGLASCSYGGGSFPAHLSIANEAAVSHTVGIRDETRAATNAAWRVYFANGSETSSFRFGSGDHPTLLCRRQIGGAFSNLAVDKGGNLMVPLYDLDTSMPIYKGPGMCGPEIARVTWSIDLFGFAVDAASLNALTGKIVIALTAPFSLPGGVLVCRASGTCVEIFGGGSSELNYATAVAIDSAGDCWASVELENASRSGYDPALDYFKHCEPPGALARGWLNSAGGGLDVDEDGNLLSISPGSPSQLFVYSGCKPQCKRIGGPFELLHGATYGHVSRDNALFFSTGDGVVDVYDYGPTAVRHRFSFRAGANGSGVAASPGR